VECVVFAWLVAGTRGWIIPLLTPNSTDFVSFYAAGALAWDGAAALAYDHSAHYAAEQAATEAGIPYQFFFYPPMLLIFLAPLSRLPYLASFYLFEAVTLTFYCLSVKPLIANRGRAWWVSVLAFPSVFWTLGLGQNTFLTAALFATGLRILKRWPFFAGMLLGTLCYKPHLGLLIPVALLAGRHYWAFLGAATTVGFLVLTSVAAFGIEPWLAFLNHALAESDVFSTGRIDLGGVVTPFAAMRLLGAPRWLAGTVQLAAGCIAAVIVWRTWRRPGPAGARNATLLAATLLAAPVLLLYDLVIAHLTLMWLLSLPTTRTLPKWQVLIVALAYVTPIMCRPLATFTHIQIGPAVAVCLLAWAFTCRQSGSQPDLDLRLKTEAASVQRDSATAI
jgi:alpha-1,2-mannosyltransferase